MKIAFCTLGCKLNQFDTALMKEQALKASHEVVPFDENADVYVVNTCSVTKKSNRESRLWIRKALRSHSEAKIVVTGCYAQTHPEELVQIKGIDLVLGTQERGEWLDYLGGCDKAQGPSVLVNGSFSKEPIDQPLIDRFADRTRAFVKVQDGCDFGCSFCIIPRARGPSRSVPIERVVGQIQRLSEKGYKEVVLTGISLGSYGRDLRPKLSLAYLIGRLLSETTLPRLRLSSIEPKTVTQELLSTIASSPRVCRHFHIPLQSGDDGILRRMNRHYTREYYRTLIKTLSSMIPGSGIGTDVMVGFPGEGEFEFENTYELLSSLPLSYFHVFSYSLRPMTRAFSLKARVSESDMKKRRQSLEALSSEKLKYFHRSHFGVCLDVLVEEERDRPTGQLKGYSDNYIRVLLKGSDLLKNRIVSAVPRSLIDQGVLGNRHPVASIKRA